MRGRNIRATKRPQEQGHASRSPQQLIQDATEKYYASLTGEELREENELEMLLAAAASRVIFDSE
jgi:hypothetical protein